MPLEQDLSVMILVKAAPVLTSQLQETMCVAAMTRQQTFLDSATSGSLPRLGGHLQVPEIPEGHRSSDPA